MLNSRKRQALLSKVDMAKASDTAVYTTRDFLLQKREGVEKDIDEIQVFGRNDVRLLKKDGSTVNVQPYLLKDFPDTDHIEAIRAYLSQAWLQLVRLSDGEYKLTANLGLLGGGKDEDLIKAVAANKLAVVRALLTQGVSPNIVPCTKGIKEERQRQTILHDLYFAELPLKSLLLINATPLFIAAYYGRCEMVDLLIKAGGDLNQALTLDNVTPLFIAADKGYVPIVELLLRAGATVDLGVAGNGSTPLWTAAFRSNIAMVDILLKAGANIDKALTDSGITPLIFAAQTGRLEVVKMLYFSGADFSKRNFAGENALDVARKQGHAAVVAFLSSPPPRVSAEERQHQKEMEDLRRELPLKLPMLLPPLAERIAVRTLKSIKCERAEPLKPEAQDDLSIKIKQAVMEWAPTLPQDTLMAIMTNSESMEVIELSYELASHLKIEIMQEVGRSGEYDPVPSATMKYAIGKWVKEKEKEMREKQLLEVMSRKVEDSPSASVATESKKGEEGKSGDGVGKTFAKEVAKETGRRVGEEAGAQVANLVAGNCSIM